MHDWRSDFERSKAAETSLSIESVHARLEAITAEVRSLQEEVQRLTSGLIARRKVLPLASMPDDAKKKAGAA